MAELDVTRKSVGTLLGEMQRRKFVIPEYQRPYKWDEEKCEILWRDLTDFFEERKPNEDPTQEYYLGTVVTCAAGTRDGSDPAGIRKDWDVIDGQQRITSLLLLLRAFYKKLDGMPPDDPNVRGLMRQVAPCIWDVDPVSELVKDRSAIRMESRVATGTENDVFHAILRTGDTRKDAEDLYSRNFEFFLAACDEFAKHSPLAWQPFLVSILKNCIILPIECQNLDTALTIFSTLNDRGMPLSDSDIFKAQIYRSKATVEDKKLFAAKWIELTETAALANIGVDDLFRYYSHVIRGRTGDTNKEVALRKFYAGTDSKWPRLKAPEVMDDLARLANFWHAVGRDGVAIDEATTLTAESKRMIHCLQQYPNEYWKYLISVYFFQHGSDPDFETKFSKFLAFLVAWLFSQFVTKPGVSAIKTPCYELCASVCAGRTLPTLIALPSDFAVKLQQASKLRLARGLILLHAYLSPDQTLPISANFEIEHIFPKVWQKANYNGWNRDDAEEFLERFGNKVAFEKTLNIQAGNGYFGQKKVRYAQSAIANAQSLAVYPHDDWAKGDIETREAQFGEAIESFLVAHLTAPPAP